ncbi:hypothetical protein OIU79_012837 [Salix purpurea]|uniref:Uncharacterized protein n=1 Tax=Salix purpurea TaxID=77065 RepID=A0A9Q0Q485_SALPP|nr:hypothetical protein OIU79_012837 [Salix purpurea]
MINYSAWSGDSISVSLTGSDRMGGRQQSGIWLDLGRRSPPAAYPEAAREALPQALAPAEVAHPVPDQEEVAAVRIESERGSVVSKGR